MKKVTTYTIAFLVMGALAYVSCNKKNSCNCRDNRQLPGSPSATCVPGNPTISCTPVVNRPLVSAQLIPFAMLSEPRVEISVASAGNKILFAGGIGNTPGSNAVSRVDIYDIASNSWSTAELSEPRYGISSAVLGNKIFFAGGYKDANRTSSRVDIYDVITNVWSAAQLSTSRAEIATGAAGSKILFAGGVHAEDGYWGSDLAVFSDRVDIYDASVNTWSTAALSERMRVGMAVATVGSKIYFAGGTGNWSTYDYNPTSKIDIYDASANSWSACHLTKGRGGLAGIAVNNKIFWAGGEIYDNLPEDVDQTEIRDINTQTTSLNCLFQSNAFFTAVAKDSKIVFFTGRGTEKDKFDIYDVTTGTWSIGVLAHTTTGSIISVNNTIYVAGGMVDGVLSSDVWKLEF